MPADRTSSGDWHPCPDFQAYKSGVVAETDLAPVTNSDQLVAYLTHMGLAEADVYDEPVRSSLVTEATSIILGKVTNYPVNGREVLQAYVDGELDNFLEQSSNEIESVAPIPTRYLVTSSPVRRVPYSISA